MPESPVYLRDHTTLRLGGPAQEFVVAIAESDLIQAASDRSALVLGGGSNLVVADEGVPSTVIKVATRGVRTDLDGAADSAACGGVLVTVAAGEDWDDFVALAVERGWVGVEALSGIPGSVGATPIQNVGAYGQEVAQTIASVRVYDRVLRGVRTFPSAECGFGYRHSRFKADPGRHLVLDVTFQFRQGDLGAPVQYAALADGLGVPLGTRVPLREVRDAVLEQRRKRGMVLDEADHDTWSAGSFFTNPVIDAERVPEGAPAWPQDDGRVKTSAAWLIEHAGFGKGYAGATGSDTVSLSTKHALALTNRGGASTAELLALAREVRDGVEHRFGIRLVNEPVLVGCDL